MTALRFNKIHAVCVYLRGKECLRCPRIQAMGHHKQVMRGCYLLASELIMIAKFGTPFPRSRKHTKRWREHFNDD